MAAFSLHENAWKKDCCISPAPHPWQSRKKWLDAVAAKGTQKYIDRLSLRRNNIFYHFLRPGQGQAIRKRMVLPAKLLPAARKSKNISLSNLVIFSTIQILTSPYVGDVSGRQGCRPLRRYRKSLFLVVGILTPCINAKLKMHKIAKLKCTILEHRSWGKYTLLRR